MADKNTTSNINLAAAEELPKAQSKFKEFVKKFMKRKTAVISLAFIVFIILMAIIGPYVVPYDPQAPDYTAMMQGPSAAHIWGTNEYGQDAFFPSDGWYQTFSYMRADSDDHWYGYRCCSRTDRRFLRRTDRFPDHEML